MALVRLRGPLKALAGNARSIPSRARPSPSCCAALEREYPPLHGWILDERGRIRRHINVFVNGEKGGEDTAIAPDDRVDVLPAISGGSA